ncbi:MAG: N-acetyltransferase family protein [Candidatus Woesearchaeota archaeon]
MAVRPARSEDIARIIPIVMEYERESASYLSEEYRAIRRTKEPLDEHLARSLENEIVRADARFLVYEDGGSIVGYAHGMIRDDTHMVYDRPRSGEFSELAVLPSHRGRGIASALWDELLDWFREEDCAFVTLSVNANNRARAIYEKWGFDEFYVRMIKKL